MINIDLETSALACMLNNSLCALDYELLSVEDFTRESHKSIYKAISRLRKKNEDVDLISVASEVDVATSYIAKITGSIPTTVNFLTYVKKLKELTLKRNIKNLSEKVLSSTLSGNELAEIIESEIFRLKEQNLAEDFIKIGDIALDVYSNIKDKIDGKIDLGLSTGYNNLDKIMGNLRKGEYILLGARPSIGKTALALNIGENNINNNKKVGLFSLEMTKEMVVERLIRSTSLVDIQFNKKLDKEKIEKIRKASLDLINKNLYINDNPNISVAEIQSMCRKLKMTEGLDLVIIDYLQKVRSSSNVEGRFQIEQVSNDLKNMAKILNVPIIVISSLSRASEQRGSKIPILSDLRDSGAIEYDADVIVFLHREYYYDRTLINKKREADIIIAKNRNWKTGRTKLNWYEEYTKFVDSKTNLNKSYHK